jgi:hypothetical protein
MLEVCLMLALGIADAQHFKTAYQYVSPPEADLNDRAFNAAMFYEFATRTKWCCSEE